ncbi:MAG: 4Fe-4S dicluster domain-containing protein, partial [Elusimicrobia bacterium]|nr:4Fe-4S dicluster domain-containing protein [Elusimicrobiota bacterium]MBD3411700.1 4Fe-4S dicluster domain-containing protein [Elusimicrobiota bacterium]
NALALDVVCADIIGLSPTDVPYLDQAQKQKLPGSSLAEITIAGDGVEQFKTGSFLVNKPLADMRFTRLIPHWLLKKWFTPIPVIDHKICKKCYECIAICPSQPKALSIKDKDSAPRFNYRHCIRCFCCQEICPHKAISIKSKFLSRFFS